MNSKLRQMAEERLKAAQPPAARDLSPEEIQATLHELQVHQIELEMQNEELRRSHGEIEALRAKYFNLYDLAPVGYLTLSEQGVITESNLTVANLLGRTRGELVRQPISRLILNEDQDTYYLHRKQLFETGEPQVCELRMVKKDTAPLWVRLDATVRPAADGAQMCHLAIIDISHRKNAEALQNRIRRVIQHDLRSPSIAALNLAQLFLKDDNMTDMQRSLLEHLETTSRQMLDILNSSLDLHKIETGQYHGTFKNMDCISLAREIAEALLRMPGFASNRIDFLIDGVSSAENAHCPCLGQQNLLKSAFRNLMQNALESSPDNEVVFVDFISDEEFHMEIRNSGVVPRDIRDRFFSEYATSGKEFGTGLGTYSAMMMIQAHGGRIEMRTSDEDNETVVTIYLPKP